MRKVVVNTTPIIALADIGQLDLLQKIYGEIVIPEAVDLEVLSEPARSLLDSTKWIKVVKPKVISQKSTFSTRLHAGEIVFASKGNLPMPCLPIIAASVHLYQFMLSKVCLAILYVLKYGF